MAPPDCKAGEHAGRVAKGVALRSREGEPALKSTYRQILSSSAWMGGASAVNVLIGIARTKAIAVLLGPAGVGLIGTFTVIADLARSVAEMGINNSGVRQIAEAASSGDAERIARTAAVLRRTAWLLGAFGAVLLIAFSGPISELTFGNRTHANAIALLSLAVLFRLVADAQSALVQGMRRIADVAKIGVLGALIGTAASIPLVYWLRIEGAALSVVAIAVASAAASSWYSRKVQVGRASLTTRAAWLEASSLLKLGFAFMASSLLTMGAAYVVRLILIRQHGLDAAGLYQAAWTLGGLYVGFVLQAMSTDFYPRLVAESQSDSETNRLVDEQTQAGVLLAGAGVLATLALSEFVLRAFYSAEFVGAAETMRWICLGIALRVLSWPMGYIIIARAKQTIFFASELAWTIVNISLTWLLIQHFGVLGAGIAFCLSYVFHLVLVYAVVSRLTGFRWSQQTAAVAVLFLATTSAVLSLFYAIPSTYASALGAVAGGAALLFSYRRILSLLGSRKAQKAP